MLVLSCRIGESLMINDDCKITILDCVGNQIRFGVSAPKNIAVHREEIWKKIQEKKLEAL